MHSISTRQFANDLTGVLRSERTQLQARQRESVPQARKPLGHLRLHVACFSAPAQQHQGWRPVLRPVASKILEYVQGCCVRPLHVVSKHEQRCLRGQRVRQARQRVKEAGGGKGPVDGRGRQVGVPLAQVGQQAGELGQPGIAQQLTKIMFLF